MERVSTKVVNFCAGPSAGKTTNALQLASMFKSSRLDVTYVPEFAYEQVLENSLDTLDDQLLIFAEQAHRLYRVRDRFEWAVTDCPLFLGIHYLQKGLKKYSVGIKPLLEKLILNTFDQYTNYTYFVERGDRKFIQNGRVQNEEQSKEIDNSVLEILEFYKIPYTRVTSAADAWQDLYDKGALT